MDIAVAYGKPTRELAFAMSSYAGFGFAYNDPRALEYAMKSAAINQQLFGTHSIEYARSEAAIGGVLLAYGKYPLSEQHLRSALATVQAWSGPDEAICVRYILRLTDVLVQEGKGTETKELIAHALAIIRESEKPSSLEQSQAYFDLGFINLQEGELNAAEKQFNLVLSIANQHLSFDPNALSFSELGLADVTLKRGNYIQAEALARQISRNDET